MPKRGSWKETVIKNTHGICDFFIFLSGQRTIMCATEKKGRKRVIRRAWLCGPDWPYSLPEEAWFADSKPPSLRVSNL